MSTGKKLWLFSGGAIAASLTIVLLDVFVTPLRPEPPLDILIVAGIWAALGLLVLLPGARREHKLAVLIPLALAVTLSFSTHWFGFVAFLLAFYGADLLLAVVLVFAAVRLFRKKPGLRFLLLPMTMIVMACCGTLLSAWSSSPIPPIPSQAMSTGDEIKYIHDTDQSDRLNGYWMIDAQRDRIRLRRVKALYRAGQITQPNDQYQAALVFQHGSCSDDYQVAYELARAAADHGVPRQAQMQTSPLVHMTWDRWQLSLGKRQTWGTQHQLFPIPFKRPCPRAP